MGRRIFYARRTMNGGKCCSFSRRGMNMNAKAKQNIRGQSKAEEEEVAERSQQAMGGAMVTSTRNVPSNKEVEKQKAKMDNMIQKLQRVNVVKKKNISFDI